MHAVQPSRRFLLVSLIAVFAALLTGLPGAVAPVSVNAAPASVTIAGSLQSELGCAGDWDPACAATHLTYDAGDDVWQGTLDRPGRQLGVQGRPQRRLGRELRPARRRRAAPTSRSTSARRRTVKFYYDHKTHWITDNVNSVIAIAPGSFQSELGCPGDWEPELPALLAAGPGWRRDLHLRDDRPPGRQLRGQGRAQRELGRELRPGRRARTAPTSPSPSRPTTPR